MNLRARYVAITASLVFLVATAMSIGAYRIASSQLENQVKTSLNQRTVSILQAFNRPVDNLNDFFGRGPIDRAISQGETDSITQIIDADGLLHKRQDLPDLPYEGAITWLKNNSNGAYYESISIENHQFRMLSVVAPNGFVVQVAKDTQILVDAQNGMRRYFPLFAALAVLISGAFAWLFASRITRPIEELAATAESIAATQDLNRNIEVTGSDEVAQLARSFNSMLLALRNSSERQRRLVQDASHELRTPLTSLRANAEILERATLTEEDRLSILADMKAEVDELADLSAELSALAIDQRAAEDPISIDLFEVATEIATRASRRTSAPVTVHSTGDTVITARPHQLERAISNLVDNAIKFSEASSSVEIHVGSKRVEVRDHGPGISDADKPLVFDRFYRATATRSMPGSGLGLAIVSQFADDNDANTYVLDNAGGGTVVGLQFK
ncbi:MAG: two-component histidine kinase MprB [Actinomycetota bacterium]|jgi:two-component system sensor histidine kinase MprB